tara:strand:- start:474 stop:818 length:345 start_codon:yes stop_codon:yes gene_type:complete
MYIKEHYSSKVRDINTRLILGRPVNKHEILGGLGEMKQRQSNSRQSHGQLPVGTLFIISDVKDLPAYDITGCYLCVNHDELFGRCHSHGYIEKGTWKYLGRIEDNLDYIESKKC